MSASKLYILSLSLFFLKDKAGLKESSKYSFVLFVGMEIVWGMENSLNGNRLRSMGTITMRMR